VVFYGIARSRGATNENPACRRSWERTKALRLVTQRFVIFACGARMQRRRGQKW
jgi:hypothetical protein